jgi:hypothetical protein
LNCTSKKTSLVISWILLWAKVLKVYPVTFFDKRSQAEYANIEMIRMLHSFQYLNYCEAGGYQ